MNNRENLRDNLLGADGLDPAGVSSEELQWFRGLLDRTSSQSLLRGRAVTRRITRWAAVAAVLMFAAAGVYFFGGGTSQVWAKVLDNVRKTDNYQYHETNETIEITAAGEERVYRGKGMTYVSGEDGMVQDRYSEGELAAKIYYLFRRKEMVTIGYADKECRRTHRQAPDRESSRSADPRQLVIRALEGEYTELGRKTVDGRVLAGIESHDQSVVFGRYAGQHEAFALRFWIDMETKLPVRMETEYAYKTDEWTRKTKGVWDQFQWNLEFPAGFFTPQIPDGFTVWTDRPDETACINSLRLFAEFMGGKYPGQLSLHTFWDEMGDPRQSLPRRKARQMASGEYHQDGIQDAFSFYEELREKGHDVAYYGSAVTPADVNSVLMHWDVSDTERRVIWGDLRVETMPLAQLGKALTEIWQRQCDSGAETTSLVQGRLVYANGRPVNQGAVYLERAMCRTNENGDFAIKAPAGGVHEYHLGHAHGPRRQTVGVFFWSVAQSVKGLDVVLDFPCTVRVRVVDAKGTLLRDATVKLVSHPEGVADDFWMLANRARIDPEGYSVFDRVPVGLPLELLVKVAGLSGGEIRVPIGELAPDQRIDMADIIVSGTSEVKLNCEQ